MYWGKCLFDSQGHMAVGDAHVFPDFLTPVLTQLSFQSHKLLLSHSSAEVRDENTPERKFTSTESQTNKPQVTTEPPVRGLSQGNCMFHNI